MSNCPNYTPTDYQVVTALISELTSDELRRVRARIEDELRLRREPVNEASKEAGS